MTRPSLLVTFYAVSDRGPYHDLLTHPDDAETCDLLVFLGYVIDHRATRG